MNISFTSKQEKYIANQIESGDFQNASEVVRDALRIHEQYRHHILKELKKAVEKGWDGEPSKRNLQDIIAEKHSRKISTKE